jgi:hypothetical protein
MLECLLRAESIVTCNVSIRPRLCGNAFRWRVEIHLLLDESDSIVTWRCDEAEGPQAAMSRIAFIVSFMPNRLINRLKL